MKHVISALILQLALTGAAAAKDICPEATDHSADLQALIAQVQTAQSETEARRIGGEMWQLWTDAPDATAQALLDRGMQRRESYDLAGAYGELDELVGYCPNYAEGYNQRAFVNYLRQNYADALVDLDRALELSPNHIAALSGKALTLLQLERHAEARIALRQALELNPWLSERALADPGGPLAPVGQDI